MDEKMKRRMSARFADISSPTDALVPDVPSLPIGIGSATSPSEFSQKGSAAPTIASREDPWVADLRLLDVDEFDSDTCAGCFDVSVLQLTQSRCRPQD